MVRCSICEQENLEESPLKHLPETLEGKIYTMTGKYYILMLLHKKEYKKRPYFSVNLWRLYSNMLQRDVDGSGLISNPTTSLICDKEPHIS